jgi:hypothetical protein
MNRPRRPALGPRSTAGRLGVRVASLSLRRREAITNTHRPSSGVALCTHGGGAFACRDGLPRTVPSRRRRWRPAASLVELASSVPPSAPPLTSLWRAQHAVKGRALDCALGRPPRWRAFRSAGTGRDYQLFNSNRSYAHLSQMWPQRPRPRLDFPHRVREGRTATAFSNILTDCAVHV